MNVSFTTINKINYISYIPEGITDFCCTTIIKTNSINWLENLFLQYCNHTKTDTISHVTVAKKVFGFTVSN